MNTSTLADSDLLHSLELSTKNYSLDLGVQLTQVTDIRNRQERDADWQSCLESTWFIETALMKIS